MRLIVPLLALIAFILCLVIGIRIASAEARFATPQPAARLLGASAQPFRSKQAPRGAEVLVQSPTPLEEGWRLDQALSRACIAGTFAQRRDLRYAAQLAGYSYGAAVGGTASLVDRGRLAVPGVVYVFRGQGTTACRVYAREK